VSSSATFASGRRRSVGGHRGLAQRADLLVYLVRRELAVRHRGSLLGWAWSLGPPLLQLLATYFLFTRVIPLDIDDYPVFLLTGILCWTWFSRVIVEATASLEARRDLVLRPGVPTELVPIATVLVGLVDYLLALPVLLVAVAATTGLHPEAAFLPVLLVVQLVLSAGIALMLAPLQILFRDIRQLATVVVTVGFWVTPIFYRSSQVPDALETAYALNPMAHLVEAHRDVLLEGRVPDPIAVLGVALAALLTLAAGWAVFDGTRHTVPEHA
jgi:lipopolysaccharide transport system permease protein